MKFTIIGLNVVKYIGEDCYGHNCDFEYVPQEFEKFILTLVTEYKSYYELTLKETRGECGSGWTTASWGDAVLERVEHIKPFGYRPKERYSFEIESHNGGKYDIYDLETEAWPSEAELIAGVFAFSSDGGDGYYPNGWVRVDLDKFEKLPRSMEKRPVWIFKGGSALGKSTIASNYADEDIGVFETDSVDELPDQITAGIVVLGNKREFSVEDVVKHLFGEPEVILVDFTKYEK